MIFNKLLNAKMRGPLNERVIGTIVSRPLYDSKKKWCRWRGRFGVPTESSVGVWRPHVLLARLLHTPLFILYMSYTEDMKFKFFRTFNTNFNKDDGSIDFSSCSALTPNSNYDYVSNILILSEFYNPRSLIRNKTRNWARENRRRMKTWL